MSDTLPHDTAAIAIVAKDEASLAAVELRLMTEGVRFSAIRESEGKHAGQLMAIGCAPCPRAHVRHIFSSFPLLKGAPT